MGALASLEPEHSEILYGVDDFAMVKIDPCQGGEPYAQQALLAPDRCSSRPPVPELRLTALPLGTCSQGAFPSSVFLSYDVKSKNILFIL